MAETSHPSDESKSQTAGFSDDQELKGRAAGAATGAAAGAVIGGPVGALAGGLLGQAVGGLVGAEAGAEAGPVEVVHSPQEAQVELPAVKEQKTS